MFLQLTDHVLDARLCFFEHFLNESESALARSVSPTNDRLRTTDEAYQDTLANPYVRREWLSLYRYRSPKQTPTGYVRQCQTLSPWFEAPSARVLHLSMQDVLKAVEADANLAETSPPLPPLYHKLPTTSPEPTPSASDPRAFDRTVFDTDQLLLARRRDFNARTLALLNIVVHAKWHQTLTADVARWTAALAQQLQLLPPVGTVPRGANNTRNVAAAARGTDGSSSSSPAYASHLRVLTTEVQSYAALLTHTRTGSPFSKLVATLREYLTLQNAVLDYFIEGGGEEARPTYANKREDARAYQRLVAAFRKSVGGAGKRAAAVAVSIRRLLRVQRQLLSGTADVSAPFTPFRVHWANNTAMPAGFAKGTDAGNRFHRMLFMDNRLDARSGHQADTGVDADVATSSFGASLVAFATVQSELSAMREPMRWLHAPVNWKIVRACFRATLHNGRFRVFPVVYAEPIDRIRGAVKRSGALRATVQPLRNTMFLQQLFAMPGFERHLSRAKLKQTSAARACAGSVCQWRVYVYHTLPPDHPLHPSQLLRLYAPRYATSAVAPTRAVAQLANTEDSFSSLGSSDSGDGGEEDDPRGDTSTDANRAPTSSDASEASDISSTSSPPRASRSIAKRETAYSATYPTTPKTSSSTTFSASTTATTPTALATKRVPKRSAHTRNASPTTGATAYLSRHTKKRIHPSKRSSSISDASSASASASASTSTTTSRHDSSVDALRSTASAVVGKASSSSDDEATANERVRNRHSKPPKASDASSKSASVRIPRLTKAVRRTLARRRKRLK